MSVIEVKVQPLEFNSQKRFENNLQFVIDNLSELGIGWQKHPQANKLIELEKCRYDFYRLQETNLSLPYQAEQELFYGIFDLFALSWDIGIGKILHSKLDLSPEGVMIGCIGPLGVSKTQIARALANYLAVEQATVEPQERNPFWRASQQDPSKYGEYMLRSQIFFLLANINADIRTKLEPTINISDTSTLTDILMWVEWYHQTGRFDESEYQAYQKLVTMLKPIIPKPDLLVVLEPDSIDHLKQGIIERQLQETSRTGELIFTEPDNKDLEVQVELMKQVKQQITDSWGVNIIEFVVDPVKIYSDPVARGEIVNQIRAKLPPFGNRIR